MIQVEFRLYEELNDFLPDSQRKRTFVARLPPNTRVGPALCELGVPPVEVELVLVNGESVDLEHRLADGDRVAAYPVFERLDVSPLLRLRAEPLRVPRFVCDVHLGRLARYLRAAGFSTVWEQGLSDPELVAIAREERRILLTRDRECLMDPSLTHGHYLRATAPREQLAEVIRALQLEGSGRPFTRCTLCNDELEAVGSDELPAGIPAGIADRHRQFLRCPACARIYWRGSHHARMSAVLAAAGLTPE